LEEILQSIGGGKTVVFVVVVVVALLVLKKVLSKPKEGPHITQRSCRCGWRGSVSRYNAKCPKCGHALNE